VNPPKYIVHKYESAADVCTSGPRYITESNNNSDSENGDSSTSNWFWVSLGRMQLTWRIALFTQQLLWYFLKQWMLWTEMDHDTCSFYVCMW